MFDIGFFAGTINIFGKNNYYVKRSSTNVESSIDIPDVLNAIKKAEDSVFVDILKNSKIWKYCINKDNAKILGMPDDCDCV
jgi:hypothetical protein